VQAAGDLVVLQDRSEEEAHARANRVILDEAVSLARSLNKPAAAVLIWDGTSRGSHDITEEFAIEARNRGLEVAEVRTI
jgi:hypothetical protein